MKRSEMVKELSKHLQDKSIRESVNKFIKLVPDGVYEYQASEILDLIEKAGMLPSYNSEEDHTGQIIGVDTLHGCKWEDVDYITLGRPRVISEEEDV